MFDKVIRFLKRNSSLVITTHDNPDADGLGAEIAFSRICRALGITYRILNSGPTPARYAFIDPEKEIGLWDRTRDCVNPDNAALLILDSSDEYLIGGTRDFILLAAETFLIDHHDHASKTTFNSLVDSTASSTCEIAVDLASALGVRLDRIASNAVYAGIVYDTGFFKFPKTTARTFQVAARLVENGAEPYKIHQEMDETAEVGALFLRKKVLSTLEILNGNRVALQLLRRSDLDATGARLEDAETFVNVPLAAKDILVSVLLKEDSEGLIRCSLRSKGAVNVARIAQAFGGGGHVTASGFRCSLSMEAAKTKVMDKISLALEN